MDHSLIRIVILLTSSAWGVYSLSITNLTVPDYVRNGTDETILLDCEYTYGAEDDKLVVKWFHNDDTTPFYQWIKQYDDPSVWQKFGDNKIEETEVLSDDNLNTSHQPILIMRPTLEMNGTYSCQITSVADTVSKKDEMIIYAIPTSVSLNVSSVDDILFVTCIAESVFPLPKMEMFHTEPGQMDSDLVEEVYLNYVKDNDAFDVFLTTNISESELLQTSGLHFFECEVTIPGTEFKKEARIPYFPTPNEPKPNERVKDDDDGAFDMRPSLAGILAFASALLVLCW